MRNILDKRCRENQNTYFMSNNFLTKIVPFMDKAEKCGRNGKATDDNIIWRMRFACWITNPTDTLRAHNIYCSSTAKYLRECASLLR